MADPETFVSTGSVAQHGHNPSARGDGVGVDPLASLRKKDLVIAAANLLRRMGASEVFIFGSFARNELRSDSDIDIAVSGHPPEVYFSAASKVSDLVGRPVDLLDLDDKTPRIRHLIGSGELVRVG